MLVDYTEASSGLPAMHVFQVVETNADYQFERDLTAGLPIIPILPLGAFPARAQYHQRRHTPPAWQDRKLEWWAVSAGNNGGSD